MTALAGCWNFDERPGAAESCRRMLAAQRLYGPHDTRQGSAGPMAMGRCLFRTLPEDAFDRQPLHGAGGRLTLVADVRLDNRDELAAALRLDHPGRLCDAGVLLAALERWGEAAVGRLVGDFAFALWDAGEQRLLLARDFLGLRPLHYHRAANYFAFASMPKGLHALPEVPYAPDEQAMAEFLTLMPTAGSASFFEGIETVRPGHVAIVTRDGVSQRRHWQPTRQNLPLLRAGDHVEAFRHHLDQATRARLRGADGAVGAHLSGGFDSGAVAATAARLLAAEGGKVVAFTSVPRDGYDGPAPTGRIGDEGPLAAATAAMHANIEHVLIRGAGRSPLADLDRYFYLFDRPNLNLCNLVWASDINAAARERRLTVMLTGQMGNMTISYAGVERLAELVRGGRLVRLWREGAQLVANGTMTWMAVLANAFGAYAPKWLWRRLYEHRHGRSDVFRFSAIHPRRVAELDLDRMARERDLDFAQRPWRSGLAMRTWVLRRIDLGNSLKGTLGGWGIDLRDPTADKRLVEFCLSLPLAEFLRDGVTRSLGRRALSDRLPPAVLDERFKGYQAVDWHEGLTAARGQVDEELQRLAPCGPAARTLDVERLRRLAAEWPTAGWERPEVMYGYRLALLRGLSAGHFLRKLSGSNR
ncbi:MAG TPA: asparagine synthase-related protein [Croceibacterium sp.]|nr:asparagine synthase-related protein [Croceibacterium sp.]